MTDQPVENHPCDGCGQLDDHPMIHVYGLWTKDDGRTTVTDPSFHFDCLPAQYEDTLGDAPQHAVTRSAIAKARDGVHGAKLRTFIQAQPSDNDLPDQEA